MTTDTPVSPSPVDGAVERLLADVVGRVGTLAEALRLYSLHGGRVVSQNDAAMVSEDLTLLLTDHARRAAELAAAREALGEIEKWGLDAPPGRAVSFDEYSLIAIRHIARQALGGSHDR